MAVRYLTGNEKVLEFGGNIGRNSLVIAHILNNNSVSLEIYDNKVNFVSNVNIGSVLNLAPVATLPTGSTLGDLAVSGSNIYFHTNSSWMKILLGPVLDPTATPTATPTSTPTVTPTVTPTATPVPAP